MTRLLTALTKTLTRFVPVRSGRFVVFSLQEANLGGAGFWSNEFGWVTTLKSATEFTDAETEALNLPRSQGNDAMWLEIIDTH